MRILNWLRDGERLRALVLTRAHHGQNVLQELSPAELPPELRPQSLLAAWDALAKARRVDAALLYHLLLVLLLSQPESWQRLNLPDPGLRPARPFKPTAAHPRAYKGTRNRPAKQAYPELDLRPYLNDLSRLRPLLQSLRVYAPEVLARLRREGFDVPDDLLERRGDPWLQLRFGHADPEALCPGLPRGHSLALLPQLQGEAPEQIIALVRRIAGWKRLDRRLPDLVYLLDRCPLRRVLTALTALQAYGPGRVLPLLASLAQDDPRHLQAASLPAIAAVLDLGRQLQSTQRDYLRWALAEDLDRDYLLAGLRLAGQFDRHHDFGARVKGSGFPLEQTLAVIAHCERGETYFPVASTAFRLWERWGEVESLAAVFGQIDWLAYEPDAAAGLLVWLTGYYAHHGSPLSARRYAELACQQAPAIAKHLNDLPASHRQKWLKLLSYSYEDHCHGKAFVAADAGRLIARARALYARLAAVPFDPDAADSTVFEPWLEQLDDAGFTALLAMPERSLLALEQMAEARNQRLHLQRGVYALLRQAPGFALAALRSHPARLLAVCVQLGLMPERHAIAARFAGSELMAPQLEALSLTQLLSRFQTLCREQGLSSPFPRKLRDWQAGRLSLSPAQLERARLRSLEQLTLTRLDWLEALGVEAVFSGFPAAPRSENLRHALLFARLTDENRRGLRRCLQQLLSGDQDYLLRHPVNQRWLARHPACAQADWAGDGAEQLRLLCRWQDQDLELSLERDPFEILKMGTYVSSCLSLGGSFMYSAIAALLDVNKQVVYARRRDGRVVARQLLCVNEQNAIVSFDVYPHETPAALQAQFLAFGKELSRRLGLSRHTGSSWDCDIALLLAQDWYNDGAWEPERSLHKKLAALARAPRPEPALRPGPRPGVPAG